jgi:predicted ATP-dependent endonuclease of OLD family
MYIKLIELRNFKSFECVKVNLNKDLNVFTGVNNSGKTTLLEGLALWSECFRKLINQAKRSTLNYKNGDYIFGPTSNKYFEFDDINSVRSPYFEDIFRDRNRQNKVNLIAVVAVNNSQSLEIGFAISDSTGRYVIELMNPTQFNYELFNSTFKNLPEAISTYYASPVSFIKQYEDFALLPLIQEAINERASSSFMRNRLYRLRSDTSTDGLSRYQAFEKDLSYILYNNSTAKLLFSNASDIHRDTRVKVNYTIGTRDYDKDIALLGSGTLQIIEILLNIYQQDNATNKDFNLILLDEPDSHIHRDIQKRLIDKLVNYARNNQIFITTHNEALIRSSDLKHLFHIDIETKGEINNLYNKDLLKTGIPHFKGIFPNSITPIIKSLGSNNGLDFINAIEAEKIIFVEGEDDARVIHRLLQSINGNDQRKFMFWVLGGVSKVLDKINTYKLFFSEIKNEKTLWDKSFLILDKDEMTDQHAQELSTNINNTLNLQNAVLSAYTMEAVLLKDLKKVSVLLVEKYKKENTNLTEDKVFEHLEKEYCNYKDILKDRYSNDRVSQSNGYPSYKEYQGKYLKVASQIFKSPMFKVDDVPLCESLKSYYNQCLNNKEFYKLMNKKDVEILINRVLKEYDLSFDIETDFYSLIQLVDATTWYDDFDFIKNI